MNTIEQIQAAILELPPEEFGKLVDWLAELDQKRWNEKFERDMLGGRVDSDADDATDEVDDDETN